MAEGIGVMSVTEETVLETDVYNIDLDEEVISHMALSESVFAFRSEGVNDELIVDPFAKEVFKWQMLHLRKHRKPATASVLADEFDIEAFEPLTAVGDLVERLRVRYIKKHAREKMEQVGETFKNNVEELPSVLVQVGREFKQVATGRGDEYGTGDYDRAMAKYDESLLRGQGPSFGFAEVDEHLYGQRGVTTLLAAPKLGKSWFTVNGLVENILQGKPSHLRSLELPAEETDMRVRCMVAGVPYWKYIHQSLSKEDRKLLKDASELLDDSGVYKVSKPPPGRRSIDFLVEEARDEGAEIVYIDQLQYIETDKGAQLGSCDPGAYWTVMNTMRDMSDHGPIWLVHQFNRSVLNASEMPEVQQAKGSAAVEETSTLILGLWANKEMKASSIVQLGVLASRNHEHKSWECEMNLGTNCEIVCNGEFTGESDDSEEVEI